MANSVAIGVCRVAGRINIFIVIGFAEFHIVIMVQCFGTGCCVFVGCGSVVVAVIGWVIGDFELVLFASLVVLESLVVLFQIFSLYL